MKVLKWITVKEFVDGETGEILKEHEFKNGYIVINKKIHHAREQRFNTISREWEEWGIKRITYVGGKDLRLF